MYTIPNEIIIVGGGSSVKEGLDLGLKSALHNKFVIGCNFAFNHFDCTFTCFTDYNFYNGYINGVKNPKDLKHLQQIKDLPLLVGGYLNEINNIRYPNTILLPDSQSTYHAEKSLQLGINRKLTGVFALTLALNLLEYKLGDIYLLGFDWGAEKKEESHYYSAHEINHLGQGNLEYYKRYKSTKLFKPFLHEKETRIFVVSYASKLIEFPKITYPTFFRWLKKETYNQDELRSAVAIKLLTEGKCI